MSYLNDELRETLQSLKRAFDDGTLVEREYEEERAHVLKRARQAYDSRTSSSSASAKNTRDLLSGIKTAICPAEVK